MRIQKLSIILLLTFVNLPNSFSQSRENVQIKKSDGTTINFETVLRDYKGKNIFPDDSKSYIKGNLNGVKTKLSKSEIKEIKLQDGSEYIVLSSESRGSTYYYIGFYLSRGKTDFFKAYSYGRQTYGGSQSINKVATVSYYIVDGNSLKLLSKKKDIKKFRENCSEFNSYVEQKSRIKDSELESALEFYNENCK